MISVLLICHLIGDFILQNHWMQAKDRDSWVCGVHIAAYSLPFWVVCIFGSLPAWFVVVVLIQHGLQDRFALHRRWMAFFRQTPADKWPVGPLCLDQAWHLGFMGALTALL